MHSQGQSNCELMFLAGAPSGEDMRNGLALSGNTERELTKFLNPRRLKIAEAYRAVVIKERLTFNGTNRKKRKAAAGETDLDKYKEIIRDEILRVKPSVIVPLDDTALETLVPRAEHMNLPRGRKSWIECFRGSILPLRPDWGYQARVIPTFHPQTLNAFYHFRAVVSVDYGRIAANLGKRGPIEEVGVCSIIRDPEKLKDWANPYLMDWERKKYFLTFDIETYGSLITCISFCFDGQHAVSVPLTGAPSLVLAQLFQITSKILLHPIPKVNQNITYDWTILERHGCPVRNVVGDTMLAGALLYPEFPKGLDFYTSIYTEIPYYKDEGKDFDPASHSRDRLYLYNAKDSLATHQIATKQLAEIEEEGLSEIYHKEIVPMLLIYKEMCGRGMLRSEEARSKLLTKYTDAHEIQESTLHNLIGDDKINLRSHNQVGELIYERLRFKKRIKKSAKGSSYRTDKITLDDILISGEGTDFSRSILKRIIILRKLDKVLQYLDQATMHDQVYRYSYNLSGTKSGRSSSSKSIDQIFVWKYDRAKKKWAWVFKNVGGSAQTVSKHGFEVDGEFHETFEDGAIARDLRSMFVPRRGYCFVEGDGSGAEARYVGVLCNDMEFMAHFDDKPKLHARTAAQIWNVDATEVDRNRKLTVPGLGVPYYDMGKRTRHAGNYGMTPDMLAHLSHIVRSECVKIMKAFHEANPKIKNVFHDEIDQILKTSRRLVTPVGRARTFFDRYDDSLLKEAISYLPQSLISDHTKFSMRRIKEKFEGANFVVEAHDGLLAEIKIDRREEYYKVFKEVYERPIDCRKATLSRDYQLVIPAELSMSEDSWLGLKEVKL